MGKIWKDDKDAKSPGSLRTRSFQNKPVIFSQLLLNDPPFLATLLYESWAQRWFIIKVAGHRWLLAWQNFKLNALRKRVPLVYDWLLLNSTDWWFQSFFIFNIFQIIYYIINYIYISLCIFGMMTPKNYCSGGNCIETTHPSSLFQIHRNHHKKWHDFVAGRCTPERGRLWSSP